MLMSFYEQTITTTGVRRLSASQIKSTHTQSQVSDQSLTDTACFPRQETDCIRPDIPTKLTTPLHSTLQIKLWPSPHIEDHTLLLWEGGWTLSRKKDRIKWEQDRNLFTRKKKAKNWEESKDGETCGVSLVSTAHLHAHTDSVSMPQVKQIREIPGRGFK